MANNSKEETYENANELLTSQEQVDIIRIDAYVRVLYATAVLLLWNRFLYFFRIFRSTGFYIRMLMEVTKDISYFLFIFSIVIVAFGHAFYLLSKNDSEGGLIDNFFMAIIDSYLIWDIRDEIFADYLTWYSWIIFVLSSIITNIVLLNLLISIIAGTYNRISDNYTIIMYKDMVHLIQENKYLYLLDKLSCLKHKNKKIQKYLFMIEPNGKDKDSHIVKQIESIKTHTLNAYLESKDRNLILERIENKEKQTHDKIEKIEEKQRNMEILLQTMSERLEKVIK